MCQIIPLKRLSNSCINGYIPNSWIQSRFLTREIGIGAAYVRNREEIEQECIERAKGLLAEEMDDDFKHIKSNAEA